MNTREAVALRVFIFHSYFPISLICSKISFWRRRI